MGKNSFVDWMLIVFPILSMYLTPIPSLSIGELVLIVMGVYFFAIGKIKYIDRKMAYFYLYASISTAFFSIQNGNRLDFGGVNYLLSYILYAIILLIYINVGNAETFCNRFVVIARAVSILSLCQLVFIQFGIGIPIFIPGLENITGKTYSEMSASLGTMCGPFSEPAYLAQYLSLGLMIILLRKNKNRRDIWLITTTIALTMKGNAVVLLVSIYGMLLLKNTSIKNTRDIFRFIVIITSAVAIVLILFENITAVQVLLSRVYEITGDGDLALTGYHGVSGYFRVKYGFDIYSTFDWYHKLFGIGICSFSLYDGLSVVPSGIIELRVTHILEHFRSGITVILIDTGILGFALYCNALFKDKSWEMRYFALILIIMQCIEAAMNTPMWMIYIFLSFKYGVSEQMNKVENKMGAD